MSNGYSGEVSITHQPLQPPARLRALVSWQASKISTIGARLTSAYMPLGARAEFAVLAALEEYGELSQAELGRRLGLDRNDVNSIVNRLQKGALIDRHPNPGDRRRNIVTITDPGIQALELMQAHAEQVQGELLRGLTSDERSQLHRLLGKVLDSYQPQPA